MRSRLPCLAALALLLAAPAAAHETRHEVRRANAIAVRAYHGDGEVLALTAYEVYSPADSRIPHQKGRTDRSGWVAFVPDAPGKWRIRILEDDGHGLDLQVDAEPPTGAAASATAGTSSSTAFVLRPLVGLAAIGAVFAALFLAYRRKGTTP